MGEVIFVGASSQIQQHLFVLHYPAEGTRPFCLLERLDWQVLWIWCSRRL